MSWRNVLSIWLFAVVLVACGNHSTDYSLYVLGQNQHLRFDTVQVVILVEASHSSENHYQKGDTLCHLFVPSDSNANLFFQEKLSFEKQQSYDLKLEVYYQEHLISDGMSYNIQLPHYTSLSVQDLNSPTQYKVLNNSSQQEPEEYKTWEILVRDSLD